MTSITSQNLGSVAAMADTSHVNRGNQVQRQNQGTAPTQQQFIQQTQAIARTTSTQILPDKNRAPQIPKKVEAGFSGQENKQVTGSTQRRRDAEEEEDQEKSEEKDLGLDVLV